MGVSPAITQAKLNELYEPAKKDGEVIWGEGGDSSRYAPVVDAFQKRFPGVKLTVTLIDTPTISTRLMTESQAKRVTLDVPTSSMTSLDTLLQRNLVLSHDNIKQAVPDPKAIGLDGKVFWIQDLLLGWVYNTRLVSQADLPKTWDDFLNPKWQGKFVFHRTAAGFEMLAGIWDDAKITSYLNRMAQQNPLQVNTPADGQAKVANGESLFTTATTLDGALSSVRTDGAPLGIVPVGPIYGAPQGLFTVPGIPHPAAAELFMLWMTTDEGKQAMAAAQVGRYNPCGPLPVDQALCGKNVDVWYADTIDKARTAARVRVLEAKALGFAS